jgi:hypothetical protein
VPHRPAAVLRLEPQMLPGLITAYDSALGELDPLMNDLHRRGRLPRAWTEDPVTEQITTQFNEHSVDGAHSAYAALRLYEQELRHVLDALRRMDADYRGTDDSAAALMRLR